MNELNLADWIMALREFYEVEGVHISNNLDILNQTTSCLIIVQPDSAFNDASKFIIDQYIMRGGKVLWLLDQVFASMDSMRNANYTLGIPRDLNLYEQLFKYGVRVNPTLVQDAQCSPIPINTGNFGNQDKQEFLPWYYYPVIIPESKHPVVKNLNSIKLEFANTLDTIAVPGVEKTILLTTSQLTKVLYAPVRISLNVVEQEPTPERFNKPHQPVAVLLEGQFHSVFENKIVELSNRTVKKLSEPTKMIVVGDGDIAKNFYNPKTKSVVPLGLDPRTGIYYGGNKNFLLNCVNYLTGDSWFIPLRSKEFRIRLLDRNKVTQEKQKWKSINTVVPVVWVILFGLVYNYIRKRRFAS
jgi:ABC-2 type transport system permease protein